MKRNSLALKIRKEAIQNESDNMMFALSKVADRIEKLEDALIYCARHARPSIVQDVAKKALKDVET